MIRNHPWCLKVDWAAVLAKKLTPPHMPALIISNFDPEYVR